MQDSVNYIKQNEEELRNLISEIFDGKKQDKSKDRSIFQIEGRRLKRANSQRTNWMS